MFNPNLSIPTHIIVGNHEETSTAALNYLKELWCTKKEKNCYCASCKQLSHHQHRFLAWIKPTRDYSIEDLQPIFDFTALALDPGTLFFFVLEQSEKLTTATANRLLKRLEEPPTGYHFILLTDNLNALLPTIISRSEVTTLALKSQATIPPLIKFFIDNAPLSAAFDFDAVLQQAKFSDSESQQHLDTLFEILELKYRQAVVEQSNSEHQLKAATEFVQTAMAKPPQSGSSVLFWRYLWVNYPRE